MKCSVRLFVCLTTALSTGAAFAQASGSSTSSPAAKKDAPVAFVYVSNSLGENRSNIIAYNAAADGRLTLVEGSPFAGQVGEMAVTGSYLFGVEDYGVNIDSFAIDAHGALTRIATTNGLHHDPGDCPVLSELVLDHTGASLYDAVGFGEVCLSGTTQSYSIEKPSGQLKYLGYTEAVSSYGPSLSFIGNNAYAYSAFCGSVGVRGDETYAGELDGFERHEGGLLTYVSRAPMPAVKPGDDYYCPAATAADPANHVAVTLQAIAPDGFTDGKAQMATYSADDHGNLTTTSTYENMPEIDLIQTLDMKMSPSGKILAIGGYGGLQLFHFNGSEPVTRFTELLSTWIISEFFWDNEDHLYVVGFSQQDPNGQLLVFTITPTSVTQAPGSPYKMGSSENVIVLPKTPRPAA
jgi:hypothetical protein